MTKRLLVVESPGKVKKLSQILGSEWIVRASCGHIRELSNEGEDSLGFTIDGGCVKCNYVARDQRAKQTIQQLKAAVKQVGEVVLATDPDREGETIAWHLKEVLGLRDVKRVVYTEITASAVRSAIANPRKLDFNLLEAEFTAKMENALDAIAQGKQGWQQYLTTWNQDYFIPALVKAKTVVVDASNNTASIAPKKYETSKIHCPECKNLMSKIKSSKVKKKYFLKCTSGCKNVVLFWSDRSKSWEAPRSKESGVEQKPPATLTSYPCPVCKKPLQEYTYTKDGNTKTMLRCSAQKSPTDKKHKDVAYFSTQKGWWSPKFGELNV